MQSKKKGIGIDIAEDGTETYRIYDDNKIIKTLSEADVQAINDGTKKVPQMGVFNDPKFLYLHNAKLDFNWIAKQGKKIEILANDLIFLGLKMNMIDHSVDPVLKSRLSKLMDKYDETIEQVK